MSSEIDKVTHTSEPMEYCIQCKFGSDGEIYNRESMILWRFRTQHQNVRRMFLPALFRLLPDFVFYDTAEQELLVIKCERRYPLSRFVMTANGLPVGTIRQRGILLNRYTFDFNGESEWSFHMPLFSVFYKGISDTGAEVRVRLARHDTWYVQISPNSDSLYLVAALAFIHRERQRFA